jgi:hypothetical protein
MSLLHHGMRVLRTRELPLREVETYVEKLDGTPFLDKTVDPPVQLGTCVNARVEGEYVVCDVKPFTGAGPGDMEIMGGVS